MKVRHTSKKKVVHNFPPKKQVDDEDNDDFLVEEDDWEEVYDEISNLEKKSKIRKTPRNWDEW